MNDENFPNDMEFPDEPPEDMLQFIEDARGLPPLARSAEKGILDMEKRLVFLRRMIERGEEEGWHSQLPDMKADLADTANRLAEYRLQAKSKN